MKPKKFITDFRTKFTGITKGTFAKYTNKLPEDKAIEIAHNIMKGKFIVGHDLRSDFKVLSYTGEQGKIRDTAQYKPYQNDLGQPRKLKDLSLQFLKK